MPTRARVLFAVAVLVLAVFSSMVLLPRTPAAVDPALKTPLSQSSPSSPSGNTSIASFEQAKKIALEIHREYPFTIYCHCKFQGKHVDLRSCGYKVRHDTRRAKRLEWEHVVPAEAFGQSFAEWREGAEQCRKSKRGRPYKGRRCAETNPEFARIEADLYNLWPEVGELNGLRSNYSMAEIPGEGGEFGDCKAQIEDRKFEPMDFAKGAVARTYMYMEATYRGRGIISSKNEKLFAAWDKMHPVSDWECRRAAKIKGIQGNANEIVESRCRAREGVGREKR